MGGALVVPAMQTLLAAGLGADSPGKNNMPEKTDICACQKKLACVKKYTLCYKCGCPYLLH